MLERVAAIAARARRIVVLTGAGVSAESGIPTFRDAQTGLWAKHDPVMLASLEGFKSDPALVWKWYDERRESIKAVEPNPGHTTLAVWQAQWEEQGGSFTVLTQNIDGLHTLAGSREVVELHGNIWQARPVDGAYDEARALPNCPLEQIPPYDGQGRLLRPHVVWFGEMLDESRLEAALQFSRRCDLFLCVGTSGVVFPAAALPLLASEAGAAIVEINPARSDFSPSAAYCLRGPSGELLPQLYEAVLGQ